MIEDNYPQDIQSPIISPDSLTLDEKYVKLDKLYEENQDLRKELQKGDKLLKEEVERVEKENKFFALQIT